MLRIAAVPPPHAAGAMRSVPPAGSREPPTPSRVSTTRNGAVAGASRSVAASAQAPLTSTTTSVAAWVNTQNVPSAASGTVVSEL